MRLRHIEVFNAIMLTGSVSAAARMLNVSQPAVTRMLQHAEMSIDFSLFRRARGRLVPTEEAIALHAEVEKLFVQLDAVRRLSNNLRKGESGHLRVLAIPSLAQSLLIDALAELHRALPSISFEISTLHSKEIIAALLLREADIGFVFEAPAHPAIQADLIVADELVAVVPKAMIKNPRRTSLTENQMRELPGIRLPADDPVGQLLAEREDLQAWDTAVEVQTYSVALRLAEKGLGAAYLDPYTASHADPTSVQVLGVAPPIALRTYALYPRSATVSVPMRQLVDAFARAAANGGAQTISPPQKQLGSRSG